MQNLNEEDFKKKYLKYKAKYLELKNLLEGGVPPKTEDDKTKYPLLTKLKTLCTSTPASSTKTCNKISQYCEKKGSNTVCDFSINEEDKEKVEAELIKKLKSEYFMNKATYLYLEGKKTLEPYESIDQTKKKIEELEAGIADIAGNDCKKRDKGKCTNDPKINGCSDGYAYGCNFDKKVFINETLNKEFKEDKETRMKAAYLAAKQVETETAINLDATRRKSVCETEYKFYPGEYKEYCDRLNKAPSFCRIDDDHICRNHIR
jgi:hypothetical protein